MQVILLGADSPIGLTVTRELGQQGVEVHAIGWNQRSIALYSRYATTSHIRETNSEDLVKQLETIGRQYNCPWVMTIGEADISWLHKRCKDFSFIKPIIPKAESFQASLDKTLTSQLANTIGIRTTNSWQIKSLSQLDRLHKQFTYPLVLKWANPLRVSQVLENLHIDIDKYHYVYNFDELYKYLAEFSNVGEYPIIQEHIPGIGLGQMIFMHEAQCIQKFQHIREAEWQPEGGVSAVCRSLPLTEHEKLMKNSVKLLQALNWEGPAMVEYRYNTETGETCLMEVNGRFWGSLPLAHHAGANFAWLWYQAATNMQLSNDVKYRENLRCRYFIPEFKRLVRILFFQHKIQNKNLHFSRSRELLRFFRNYISLKTHYYVWSPTDPVPFFADMYGIVKKVFAKFWPETQKEVSKNPLRSIASKY